MVLGGVPIWTLTHSETICWSQMRNSRNQERRSREIRPQLLNISAFFFFPLSSHPSPVFTSSIDSLFSDSFQALQSISRMAVVNSCRTTQLFNSSTAEKKKKKKRNCRLLEGVSPRPELLEGLRQSVTPPCHGRCLLMTWQRCHNCKGTRANLGVPLNNMSKRIIFFLFCFKSPSH